jgi:hypothetical protein
MDSFLPTCVFIGTAAIFVLTQLRKDVRMEPSSANPKEPEAESNTARSIQNGHVSEVSAKSIGAKYVPPISKEKTLELRRRHFGKNVTLSYSNTGSLMIVGVSLDTKSDVDEEGNPVC